MGHYPQYKLSSTLNISVRSDTNESSFKQIFLERGFSDVVLDYTGVSPQYCRVNVIENGHPIFMWPEGAKVKLYLSPYFALGRNEDGTVKENQVPLFETPDVKITKFYSVQFLYGGLSVPYYGIGAVGQEDDGRWYVVPPLVGYGADNSGTWYRLDLTYIQFLFETPFTTNVDIQNFLRRKYLATKTNNNSTNSSKYSGSCSMSDLATMMGFSDIEHSNNVKSAINTPVKIYEVTNNDYVCYGVCFGREDHDKTTMAGYGNLLEENEHIKFIQTDGRYINLKWWRWCGSKGDNKAPGEGDWVENRLTQTFSKSIHYIERAEYANNFTYENPTSQGDTLKTILQNYGFQDISTSADSWYYDSTLGTWCGTDLITLKHPWADAIKTSGKIVPENPSYSYRTISDDFVLPFNFAYKKSDKIIYHVSLDKFALCRFLYNSFLTSGKTIKNWTGLLSNNMDYVQYNIDIPNKTDQPVSCVQVYDYRANGSEIKAFVSDNWIGYNTITTQSQYKKQYISDKGSINNKNLIRWGQTPQYRINRIFSGSGQNLLTPINDVVFANDKSYNINNRRLIKGVRFAEIQTTRGDKSSENNMTFTITNQSEYASFILNYAKYNVNTRKYESTTGTTLLNAVFKFFEWDPYNEVWEEIFDNSLIDLLNDLYATKEVTQNINITTSENEYNTSRMKIKVNNMSETTPHKHSFNIIYQTSPWENLNLKDQTITISATANITNKYKYLSSGVCPKSYPNIPFQQYNTATVECKHNNSSALPSGIFKKNVDLMGNHKLYWCATDRVLETHMDTQVIKLQSTSINGCLLEAKWDSINTTPQKTDSYQWMSQLSIFHVYNTQPDGPFYGNLDGYWAAKYYTTIQLGVMIHTEEQQDYYEEYLLLEEAA